MLSGYFDVVITKEVRMSFRGWLGYCEDFTINIQYGTAALLDRKKVKCQWHIVNKYN